MGASILNHRNVAILLELTELLQKLGKRYYNISGTIVIIRAFTPMNNPTKRITSIARSVIQARVKFHGIFPFPAFFHFSHIKVEIFCSQFWYSIDISATEMPERVLPLVGMMYAAKHTMNNCGK